MLCPHDVGGLGWWGGGHGWAIEAWPVTPYSYFHLDLVVVWYLIFWLSFSLPQHSLAGRLQVKLKLGSPYVAVQMERMPIGRLGPCKRKGNRCSPQTSTLTASHGQLTKSILDHVYE